MILCPISEILSTHQLARSRTLSDPAIAGSHKEPTGDHVLGALRTQHLSWVVEEHEVAGRGVDRALNGEFSWGRHPIRDHQESHGGR